MRKIRVLQFPIANTNAGITHYELGNWKWMNKDKFQCDFATMSKTLSFEKALGGKAHYISCYAEENREKFIKEFNTVLDFGYDVVHLHTKHWKSFVIEELCREHHIPKVIVHAHNSGVGIFGVLDGEKRKREIELHEKIKKQFSEDMATDFWACSEMAADFLFGEQIPRKKIKVMPNAIELEQFAFHHKIRDAYRKKYGLENCFVVGHTGRFEYQKNHEFLIQVFYEVSKRISSARLVLLGDGMLAEKVKEQVSAFGIEDKVLFMGRVNNADDWYQVMDVFCMPSRFEGLSFALVEAQASGLPCIISDSITEESLLTEAIVRLPFDVALWRNKIIATYEEQSGYLKQRSENIAIGRLKYAGYDIKEQVKRIEEEYMRGICEC